MEMGTLIFGHSRGEYEISRNWETFFCKSLDKMGLDNYGLVEGENNPYENNRGGITTDLFEINPYYWGEDEDEAEKPNFIYYPTGYELRWYKYPLRDSYANKDLSFMEFADMIEKCVRYIYGRR